MEPEPIPKPMSVRLVAAVAVIAMSVAASPPASAGEYTILVYETQADLDLRDRETAESAEYWGLFARFAEILQTSGMMRGGAPLRDPASAHTIRAGAPASRGGYADSHLRLSGYFQIEAPSLDAAMKLASQVPAIARGGAVEVRETYPAPTMMQ